MKALLLRGPRDLTVKNVPVPTISDTEVLVEIKFCGICGTDARSFLECKPYAAGTYIGHECSGTISEVGRAVKGWRIGYRVVVRPRYMCGHCWGCLHGRQSLCAQGFARGIGFVPGREYAGAFAKFVRIPIPDWRLVRLPEEVSFEEGALVEPLACALHAVRLSDFGMGAHVMVLGTGTIGLGVIMHLKNAGAGLIIATETNDVRLDVAKRFGADFVFSPLRVPNLRETILKLTGGDGVDIVFDCSGVSEAFVTATQFLRPGGQIMLEGIIDKPVPILPVDFTLNEWNLRGAVNSYEDEFPIVLELLAKGTSHARELITSKVSLSDVVKLGFGSALRKGTSEIKILVSPEL